MAVVNADPLNLLLSSVLIDGSNALEIITHDKTALDKTVNAVKKASEKIYNIGGKLTGALWTGANYITGGGAEEEDRVQETGRVIKPSVYDVDKQYTAQDLILLKELDKFSSEETLLQKFLDHYTKLEKLFLKSIKVTENQSKNYQKMSEKFGNIG